MDVFVVLLGILGQALAHRRVARDDSGAWTTMGLLSAVLLPLVLLTDEVTLEPGSGALAIGTAAGVVLYLTTQGFLAAVRRWGTFVRDARHLYTRRGTYPLGVEVSVGALVGACEELFWRGLTISVLAPSLGWAGAAFVALALFVGVNAVSGSRPLIIGALVGGAVWTWLALWPPGGLLSALTCHIVWTMLMIAFPRRDLKEPGPSETAPRTSDDTR